MTQITVKALSEEIGTPVDRLLEQLADAGMNKAVADHVSEDEKQKLLAHLRKEHGDATGSEPTRLTLQRKTRSTLSVNAGGGKSKNVQVEVRKNVRMLSAVLLKMKRLVKRKKPQCAPQKSKQNVKLKKLHNVRQKKSQT